MFSINPHSNSRRLRLTALSVLVYIALGVSLPFVSCPSLSFAESSEKTAAQDKGKKGKKKSASKKDGKKSSAKKQSTKKKADSNSATSDNTDQLAQSSVSEEEQKVEKSADKEGDSPEKEDEEEKEKEFVFSEYFPPYLKKATAAYERGDYDAALSAIDKKRRVALSEYPDKFFLLEGLCYFKMRDFEKAEALFRRSLRYRGSNSDTMYHLAISEYQLDKKPEALLRLEEALWFEKHAMIPPEQIYRRIGFIYREHDLITDAKDALLKALSKNNTDPEVMLELSQLYLMLDEKSNALPHLRKAIELAPEEPKYRLKLTRALLFQPDRVLGKKELEEAKEVVIETMQNPDLAPHHRFEATELHIKTLIENEEFEEARKSLEEAHKKYPNHTVLADVERQLETEEQALVIKEQEEELKLKLENEEESEGFIF